MTRRGALRGRQRWTPAEDDTLRAAYASGGLKPAQQALPHRSATALTNRAHRIACAYIPHWTPAEDELLRWLWGARSMASMAARLKRTALACYTRGRTIGLRAGCPQGSEYLSHAAARTGYAVSQIRHILRWAGYPIKRAVSMPRRNPRWCSYVVDPHDVNAAIARWHDTESCESAARRLGVCGVTLRYRLRAIGLQAPGSHRQLRVTQEQVEHALALRCVAGHLQPPVQGGSTP